jgi:DGQHR domain-containing protein
LDWKRIAHIAAYLLQKDIYDASALINQYFKEIYEPRKLEPGREWPPRVNRIVTHEPSEYPSFSSVLVHINGARLERRSVRAPEEAALLVFDANDKNLRFTVIDGQHRVNGAYLALCILRKDKPGAEWQIPAEVFLDLDEPSGPPKIQAQIFIDINFHQKKVDRSLVADLFPTTRAGRDPVSVRERAQDIGRRLMLDTGPLVGMIQIPGIRYGVKNVVALATLVGAIEDVIPDLDKAGLTDINSQTEFFAQTLTSWLDASGRRTEVEDPLVPLDPQNVVYQGRVLVAVLSLTPAALVHVLKHGNPPVSQKGGETLRNWFRRLIVRAGFMQRGRFIDRDEFKEKGFLGSGGIARFRDRLWAGTKVTVNGLSDEAIEEKGKAARSQARRFLESVKR